MGSTPSGGAPQQPGQTQDSAKVARACCPRPPQSAHSEAEGRGESRGFAAVRFQLLLAVCSEEPPAPSEMLGAGRTAPRGHGGFPRGWGPLLSCSGVGASPSGPEGKGNEQSVGASAQTAIRLYCSKLGANTESQQGPRGTEPRPQGGPAPAISVGDLPTLACDPGAGPCPTPASFLKGQREPCSTYS